MKHFFTALLAGCLLPGALRAQLLSAPPATQTTNLAAHSAPQPAGLGSQRQVHLRQALASAAGTRAYRDTVRARFGRLLGPLPLKAKFKAVVVGTVPQTGYRVERVIYESLPRHRITANLYVPDGAGQFPAVLLLGAADAAGKAAVATQQTAGLLARHGLVVLVADPICQGERRQLTDAEGQPLVAEAAAERHLLNAGASLLGTSTAAAELWDNVRGLDYLLTRPEVNPERLGCLGQGEGASRAAWLAGYDERVRVAALSGYHAADCGPVPGLEGAGLTAADWPIMVAPRPLLLAAGPHAAAASAQPSIYQELQPVYAALGEAGQIGELPGAVEADAARLQREAVAQWLRRQLAGDQQAVGGGEEAVLPEKALRCTLTGQVNTTFGDEQDLAQRHLLLAREWAARRRQLRPAELTAAVRQQLGLPTAEPAVSVEWQPGAAAGLRAGVIRRPNQEPLSVWVARPANGAAPSKVVLWLSDRGRQALADSAALLPAYRRQGWAVVLADLRGLGSAQPVSGPGSDTKSPAQLALAAGEPLLAAHVADVLALLRLVEQEPDWRAAPLEIHAAGWAAPAALHAAVLTPAVARLELYQGLPSFQLLLEQPVAPAPYALVLPGVLRRYDLPDLAALLGPRRLVVHRRAEQ
ncbi:hypothetical protein [Hymenobacter sp. B81]|uniref:hypothetical protein n=1 Tax=Hymenobacter sp. B81 TaxID=3344878 RepID=UPI0037DBFBB6